MVPYFNASHFTNDSIHVVIHIQDQYTPADLHPFCRGLRQRGASPRRVRLLPTNFIFPNSSMTLSNILVPDGSSFTMHDGSSISPTAPTDVKKGSKILWMAPVQFQASNACHRETAL